MEIKCTRCGATASFGQPYAYHAGFSDVGFLYNDGGDLTLVWSSFDPAYEKLVGSRHPWTLGADERRRVEGALGPAPHGGLWRFSNQPRCVACHEPIGESILKTIYFLVYRDSLVLDDLASTGGLAAVLAGGA